MWKHSIYYEKDKGKKLSLHSSEKIQAYQTRHLDNIYKQQHFKTIWGHPEKKAKYILDLNVLGFFPVFSKRLKNTGKAV